MHNRYHAGRGVNPRFAMHVHDCLCITRLRTRACRSLVEALNECAAVSIPGTDSGGLRARRHTEQQTQGRLHKETRAAGGPMQQEMRVLRPRTGVWPLAPTAPQPKFPAIPPPVPAWNVAPARASHTQAKPAAPATVPATRQKHVAPGAQQQQDNTASGRLVRTAQLMPAQQPAAQARVPHQAPPQPLKAAQAPANPIVTVIIRRLPHSAPFARL